MNFSEIISRIARAVLATMCISTIAAFAGNGVQESDVFLGDSSPSFLTAGPDGNLWATEARGNSVIRINPADGSVTRFDSGAADEPTAICTGPDGNLWFGSALGSLLGRITPGGALSVFTGFGGLQTRILGICAGPDGNLWFTQFGGNRIGRAAVNGAVTDFMLPAGSSPVGICAGTDGNLWFTEFGSNRIGRITPAGAVVHFDIPTPDSGPIGICAGPKDMIFFTEAAASKIGMIDPGGNVLAELVLPPGSQPNQIVAGPDDNIWFTMLGTHRIGRITAAGELTEFAVPTSRGGPDGIAVVGSKVFAMENLASALASVSSEARVLRFSSSRLRVAENGAAKVTIARAGNPTGSAGGQVEAVVGTATEGVDFRSVSKRVTLKAGGSAVVAMPIVKDSLMESDETFSITLDAVNDTVIAEPSNVEVTILDSVLALFAGSEGNYSGLVSDAANTVAATGFLQLKLLANGRFTGKLALGGRVLPFKGTLDSFGDFNGTISRGEELPLTFTLHLEQSGVSTLAGTISDGTFAATFSLERARILAPNATAPESGRYTIAVFTDFHPGGRGFGTLLVSPAGVVKFVGVLGDATKVTFGAGIRADGSLPFFLSLYVPRGFLTGHFAFQPDILSDGSGRFRWLRPANAKSKLYPGGFDTTALFFASRYVAASPVLAYPDVTGNAQLQFAGGNLPLAIPDKTVTLAPNNRVTFVGDEPFRFTINLPTGLFTGAALEPSTNKLTPFSGAIYQRGFLGAGHFIGNGETGRVDLLPAP